MQQLPIPEGVKQQQAAQVADRLQPVTAPVEQEETNTHSFTISGHRTAAVEHRHIDQAAEASLLCAWPARHAACTVLQSDGPIP